MSVKEVVPTLVSSDPATRALAKQRADTEGDQHSKEQTYLLHGLSLGLASVTIKAHGGAGTVSSFLGSQPYGFEDGV